MTEPNGRAAPACRLTGRWLVAVVVGLTLAAAATASTWPSVADAPGGGLTAGGVADRAFGAESLGGMTAAESNAYVQEALQAGQMCGSDSVVWAARNASNLVRISTVDDFLAESDRCLLPCGGLCPGEPVQRVFLLGPYPTSADALAGICQRIEAWGRDPISSPCPVWIKVGGNQYRLSASASSYCGWGPGPTPAGPTPVPTGSGGQGQCVPVPASPTPPPTATPEPISLYGKVYSVPELDLVMPLLDVPVILLHRGAEVDRAVTTAPNGSFRFEKVPVDDGYTLRVELRQTRLDLPGIFQVVYGAPVSAGGRLVYAELGPFDTRSGGASDRRDIIFDAQYNDPPLTTDAAIPRQRLSDLGVVYYHAHQAWELADSVSQVLDDHLPLDIVAYSSTAGTKRVGASTVSGPGAVPFINIDAADSAYANINRPDNREWHEFGHNVMADAFGNLMPWNRGDVNHGGAANNSFVNPSSTDAWCEGFAEFYSLVVARDIAGELQPEIYAGVSLEANLTAPVDEEFAVAGLLWDLVDPVNANDASKQSDGVTYADCIDVSFANQLWDVLVTDWGDAVPKSPGAPADYGYIFDVRQLYDVLKLNGVGQKHSRGRALTDLDELFVAHGFWADLNGDRRLEAGEGIGSAADALRPNRRVHPQVPGSYVAFDAVDADSGAAVAVDTFDVEVRFDPPFEQYTYKYRTNSQATPGHLYYFGPDPQYAATAYFTARAPGYVTAAPLAIDNATYWRQMATHPADHFATHTFVMARGPAAFLPRVTRGGGQASTALGALSVPGWDVAPRLESAAGGSTNTPTFTPCPCQPDTATPRLTATATARRTPGAPIVESVEPSSAPSGVDVPLTVRGQNFQPGAMPYVGTARLEYVEQPDTETLRGVLPAGLPDGTYDIVVINPGGLVGQLPAAFRIGPPSPTATTPAGPGSPTATATALPTASLTVSPTPSATFTTTPTPTATPGDAVWLGSAFVSAADNSWESVFATFEDIALWLEIRNTTGAPATVDAQWEVDAPGGVEILPMGQSNQLTVNADQPFWRLQTMIPSDLTPGEYTFIGRVTYGGRTTTASSLFYLASARQLAYDFEGATDDWPSGAAAGGAYGIVDGTYSIRVDAPGQLLWAVPRGGDAQDFAAEVTGYRQNGEDGTYGLLFSLSDDASSYTAFQVDHRGRYSLQSVTKSPDGSVTWQTLVPWSQSQAVRAWNGINNLLVVRRGEQVTLYANGQRLAAVDVAGLPPHGRVGLIAGTVAAASAEHRFDNFRLYRIASEGGP